MRLGACHCALRCESRTNGAISTHGHQPLRPPKAEVIDVVAPVTDSSAPLFFPVSTTKLAVMSLCTLGLYEYYWLYKNWKIVRDRTGENISPFWRTFFSVFFVYQLFDRVRKQGADMPAVASLAAGPLAAGWIVLSLLWKLPDPYWLITFLTIVLMLPVQGAINTLNAAAAPAHDRNDRFAGWNWVAIVLGGLIFVLAIIGTLMPGE